MSSSQYGVDWAERSDAQQKSTSACKLGFASLTTNLGGLRLTPLVARLRQLAVATRLMAMLLFGGHTLHYFAVALTIGILFGIYSSVFVAAAVAMWLGVRREDLIKPIKEKDETDGAVV